ncbi:hypothetical protein CVT25_009056 [Psilocybe cyanescens]|uniref:Uncharacterized protein n=1 Tax=Psilocybe cyanescens TaxID=93625 RepID=A0A409XCS8_PSICY|nr:hypothetical protein CVT25_009056 [Psilocybe cyanescens]
MANKQRTKVIQANPSPPPETPEAREDQREPPRRGRGRPKKVVAATIHPDQEETTAVKISHKRSRKDTVSVNTTENEPAAKCTKGDNAEESHQLLQHGQTNGQRKAALIPPRDQLPDRKGRNVHPVPKAKGQRSHQEVEADREAKKRAIEERIQQLMEAKRQLTETNMLEDIQIDAMDNEHPQR